jgi:AcrR family transcriptional regulator
MTGKREEKRDDLRQRLIDATEKRIVAQGLTGLRAREIAQDAGCALGAIYTVFADLDDLILHAGARTLQRLGQTLSAAVERKDDPETVLQALAGAYLDFALEHRKAWEALFDHNPPEIPDWLREQQVVLIAEIVKPLRALLPQADEKLITARARTLFAAVHGVIDLSLEGRFASVGEARLRGELQALVETLVRGSRA